MGFELIYGGLASKRLLIPFGYEPKLAAAKDSHAVETALSWAWAFDSLELTLARKIAGIAIDARNAMIAKTIMTSISVKELLDLSSKENMAIILA